MFKLKRSKFMTVYLTLSNGHRHVAIIKENLFRRITGHARLPRLIPISVSKKEYQKAFIRRAHVIKYEILSWEEKHDIKS